MLIDVTCEFAHNDYPSEHQEDRVVNRAGRANFANISARVLAPPFTILVKY